jgi:hypothetical protein
VRFTGRDREVYAESRQSIEHIGRQGKGEIMASMNYSLSSLMNGRKLLVLLSAIGALSVHTYTRDKEVSRRRSRRVDIHNNGWGGRAY